MLVREFYTSREQCSSELPQYPYWEQQDPLGLFGQLSPPKSLPHLIVVLC
ncbi:19444_t:CDS:2 [Dentiscutata erythropus]|uniref:19444_t:CDS:1 n=1 Tax=Dentiscutata erythropus TaxID=1348616 RepID=A0A9N9AR04_9GLOM|nr:19444_t:CDS:2 [Dentiscutata erythropus]